jgi:hypothetical protein
MTDYITEREFLDYIKSGADAGNAVITDAIAAASRQVEAFCGRYFYQREDTTLYYSATSTSPVLDIDDLATATDLEVRTGSTYGTLLTIDTDFVLEPRNQQFGGRIGWPYTSLRSTALGIFPIRYYAYSPDTVQITGTFGWPEVPTEVKQATKILASQFYKLADAPLGVAGYGAYGEIRVRDIPQAATLLGPYRKGSSFGIA